jgi:hypothetical protein
MESVAVGSQGRQHSLIGKTGSVQWQANDTNPHSPDDIANLMSSTSEFAIIDK